MSARGFQNKWRDQRLPSLQCSGLHRKYSFVTDHHGARESFARKQMMFIEEYPVHLYQRETRRILQIREFAKNTNIFYYTSSNARNAFLCDRFRIPSLFFFFVAWFNGLCLWQNRSSKYLVSPLCAPIREANYLSLIRVGGVVGIRPCLNATCSREPLSICV